MRRPPEYLPVSGPLTRKSTVFYLSFWSSIGGPPPLYRRTVRINLLKKVDKLSISNLLRYYHRTLRAKLLSKLFVLFWPVRLATENITHPWNIEHMVGFIGSHWHADLSKRNWQKRKFDGYSKNTKICKQAMISLHGRSNNW